MWVQQKESFILCLCDEVDETESEIEGGEVRGRTHPLNPQSFRVTVPSGQRQIEYTDQ